MLSITAFEYYLLDYKVQGCIDAQILQRWAAQ